MNGQQRWATIHLPANYQNLFAQLKNSDCTLAQLCEQCQARIDDPPDADRDSRCREWSWNVIYLASGAPLPAQPSPLPLPPSPSEFDVRVDLARLKTKYLGINVPPPPSAVPSKLSDAEAVEIAYGQELNKVNSYLNNRLSVLLEGDKIIFAYFLEKIAVTMRLITSKDIKQAHPNTDLPRAMFTYIDAHAHENDWILVLDLIDIWAHSGGNVLNEISRNLIEALYRYPALVVVATVDRTLELPPVLRKRFDVRVAAHTIPRDKLALLVTAPEQAIFAPFRSDELYKNVAGLNVVQLRHALSYMMQSGGRRNNQDNYRLIREFKTEMVRDVEIPSTELGDIAGYSAVKQEIEEMLRQMELQSSGIPLPEYFSELIPRGILFHGPPGTGKTMFSKAIANSMNAVIEIINGPEIISKWVGESEHNLRDIFIRARNNAPAVVVFDEIDAIAARRGQTSDSASRAANALVNQLLTEMDGFKPSDNILIIGTTNRPKLIDEALKRPGRFRMIEIPMPDSETRQAILEKYLEKYGYGQSHAREYRMWAGIIAAETEFLSGDHLHTLCKEVRRKEIWGQQSGTSYKVDIEKFGEEVGKLFKARIQAEQEHLSHR